MACSSTATAPSLTGQWGGNNVALTIGGSSHVELSCARGDFTGAVTSPSFQLPGTYVREHGGPIGVGEVPDSHPALYEGSVAADTMTLTIRLSDTGESVGVFTLNRGSAGHVVKCL